jgi:multisubunit Na+/H+ antiporter MnhF subunit
VRNDLVFFAGIAWLAVLLAATIAAIGRARTTAERLVALDAAVLVLIGLLGLVAAETRRSYVLVAALVLALLSFVVTLAGARYLGDWRPFDNPTRRGRERGGR